MIVYDGKFPTLDRSHQPNNFLLNAFDLYLNPTQRCWTGMLQDRHLLRRDLVRGYP